ncbi:GNAT family N-acetyltransferase [Beijerinckia sp. L45]|uniref:GNAT family N-acetyltransferase n=1 Tax=Beijerinckia sp. L45 TaxID=1641855 RepID=UPI00131D981B|nr:GNAT family N-acetyltransferase [Beijerinckia sp. L45]
MQEVAAGCYIIEGLPTIADFVRLRRISGLTPRSETAAEAGLPAASSQYASAAARRPSAWGRIISDGALFFHLIDVAIDPAHQGKGLGKAVVSALMAHVRRTAPAEAYVSLMANGEAHRLYAQFGFAPVLPDAQGMALWVQPEPNDAPNGSPFPP